MRISDWSSDVCSSDLLAETDEEGGPGLDADAVPRARAVGRQPLGVLRGVLGIGIGIEIRQVRVRIVFVDALDIADAHGHETLAWHRSEEHTSELQSLMRISYAVFCLKKKKTEYQHTDTDMTTHKY